MKKMTTFLCAAMIASVPFATAAQAATAAENNQPEKQSTLPISQKEDITSLSLEDVIKRALENEQNLVVLQYQLESLKNQTLGLEDDKRDTEKDIRDLERKLDKLKKERDRLTDAASRIANAKERMAIMDGIEALEDKITALEKAAKQLESGEFQLTSQTEEAKEGITLKLTSTYATLLNLQEQMDFTKKAIQTAGNETRKMELLYEYGAGSKEVVDQAKREQVNLEKQLEQLERNYHHDLATLAFDINVQYRPDLYLMPLPMNVTDSVELKNDESVIEGTFQMKRAKDSLELAKYNRDEVYKDEDSNQYEKAEQDYKVKAAEETIVKLHEDITKKIDALKHNADMALFNYEETTRKLEDTKKDLANLQKKYEVGLVSKYDYEKAKIQLDQCILNVETAKTKLFMVQQSIGALKKGYVQ